MTQTTSNLLMVRPANFGFNPETAGNNFYQKPDDRSPKELNRIACAEFDGFVDLLNVNGMNVLVVEDYEHPVITDAVFPNNWFSTHDDGKLILYPMFSPNRRLERRRDLIEILMDKGFKVNEIIDLSFFEEDGQYLEGTGSVVLDRVKEIIYACHSIRTHKVPLGYLGQLLGYKIINFDAVQIIKGKTIPIYHTNVMMHVGTDIAVVCLESVATLEGRMKVQENIEQSGKKIIPITVKQKFSFAGNMLEVKNAGHEKFTVISDAGYQSLTKNQIRTIEKYTKIINPKIPVIEKLGGGSARCMMAEIFLPSM